ncbi:MAG TPA: hypothetical protein VK698_02415 [Kofleriaceae bacterium]|nr:hypothetical protein [Kofleriaceae bacterium]
MTTRATSGLVNSLAVPLALCLAAGCAMEGEDDFMSGDEPGMGSDQASGDETVAGEVSADETVTAEAGVDSGTEEDSLTPLLTVNFESYAGGALGSPWTLLPASNLTDTRASIESTGDHGKVLLLQGSSALSDYLIAKLSSSVSGDIVATVDVKADSGASFVWSLNGQGASVYGRRIRLQRWPGSSTLVATAVPSGDTSCGSLSSGRWNKVQLVMHTNRSPHTFDVRINGAATACKGLATELGAPFTSVQIMDASNASWGGNVRFDNISLARP